MSYELTPTQELVMEVLAARHRTGEHMWTFSSKPAITRAARELEELGLVWTKSGQVEHTFQAGLTREGKRESLDSSYTTPLPPNKIDVLTITLNHSWYRENSGYATFADWVGDFLEAKFKGHYILETTHSHLVVPRSEDE